MESCTVDSISLDNEKKEIVINEVLISDPTFYDYLQGIDEANRIKTVERIFSLGFTVLQSMNQTNRVDYVKTAFDRMISDFEKQFSEAFSDDGSISGIFDSYFGERGDVTRLLSDHLGEDGTLVTKLLNPSDVETPLGKFKRDLEKLLDVQDKNSSFYQIQECVQTCFNDLSEQIRTQEAVKKGVAAERGKGTAKGRDFQEFLTEITDEYAAPLEDKVTFVGDTKGTTNKKGDVLIEINPSNTKGIEKRIIIEAKNSSVTMSGKDSFLTELDESMKNRSADFAIGAIYEEHTPRSIGAIRRFSGNRIVVSIPEDYPPITLEVAYKVARSEIITEILAGESPVDAVKIIEISDRAIAKLSNMRAIRSTLKSSVDNLSDIHTRLGTMENEVKDDLLEITSLLQNEDETNE
jgi:hypothetical protein